MDTTQARSEEDLDELIWGAINIGRKANVVDEKTGEVDEKATYYKLKRGYIPAEKAGAIWVSTLRKIRSIVY
jgi:hypothetical protein